MAGKTAPAATDEANSGGKKKKLLLIAIPVVFLGIGAGLWFSGILPGLLGMQPAAEAGQHGATSTAHGAPAGGQGAPAAGHGAAAAAASAGAAIYFDMPDVVANLNAPGRRATYIKLRSKLEISRAEDAAALTQAMPRLIDLFTVYLREIRPEELRGSAGTHRLREELMVRANLAAAPARVTDVLFLELLVQ